MGSACFPRLILPIDASLSSTGSSKVSSPASTVLSKRYDFLQSVPPHFVSFVWRYLGCTRKFAPRRPSAPSRPGVVHPVAPAGMLPRRRQDLPSSWGTSIIRLHMFQTDAGRTAHTRPYSAAAWPLLIARQRLPRLGLSTLNSMAFGLAVYAS